MAENQKKDTFSLKKKKVKSDSSRFIWLFDLIF